MPGMYKVNTKVCIILAFYLFLAMLISWPLVLHLDGFLLSKNYPDISHSDTLLHLKRMQEARANLVNFQDPVIADYAEVSQVYVFFSIILTLIFKVPDIIAYNIFFILTIFLAGLFMYFFAQEIVRDRLFAFFSGFLYMSSKYMVYAYYWGHTNIWQIGWIPFIFWSLEKFLQSPKTKNIFFFALAISLQILSSTQYTIYLSVIILLYLALRLIFYKKKFHFNGKPKTIIMNGIIFFSTIYMFSGYYIFKKLILIPPYRPIQEIKPEWVLRSLSELIAPESFLYIGVIPLLLALLGLYIVLKNFHSERYKKFFPFFIVFVAVAILMMGPFSAFAPYYWLYVFWPGFTYVRVPFRFFPFALLGSSVTAPIFLLYMTEGRNTWKHRKAVAVGLIILILFIQMFFSSFFERHIFYL